MTAVDLAALRAKAEAATPGPWSALTTGRASGDHWYIVDDGEALAYITANDGSDEEQREPNARYMAAVSPDVVLALLDRIAELEADATDIDAEPCQSEKWSWDLFRPEQVDGYWMRCHLLGEHDEHENSETGAKWKGMA